MINLSNLKQSILADGKIDKDEVILIKDAIYADGKIDKDEADFLFELNDAVSGKDNDSSWEICFVDAITSYLLDDEQSQGFIDGSESNWLVERIDKDGTLDSVEKSLIINLKNKSKNFPSKLEKYL